MVGHWNEQLPYLWETDQGELHVDIPRLLRFYGYADTPANREIAMRAAMDAFKQLFPDTPVYVGTKYIQPN